MHRHQSRKARNSKNEIRNLALPCFRISRFEFRALLNLSLHALAFSLLVPAFAGLARADDPVKPDAAAVEFFEKDIRPLLVEKCHKCHADKKTSGGLSLTRRAAILRGGRTGPARASRD